MTIPEISNTYVWVNKNLSEKKFAAAFYLISQLLKELNDYNLNCRYDELVGYYRNILNFRLLDTEENDKDSVFNHFLTNLYSLAENAKEQLFIKHSSRLEYSQIRAFAVDSRYFIPKEVQSFGNIYDILLNHYLSVNVNDMINNKLTEETENRLYAKHQRFLGFAFNNIWLSFKNDDADLVPMKNILDDENIGIDAKCIVISALTLNILRIFNTKKLEILFYAVEGEKQEIRQRALVGIMLILAKFGHYFKSDEKLKNRFLSFIEENGCLNEMESIVFQLIRTSETEGITRKIEENIFPEFIKMSPVIRQKFKDMGEEKEKNDEKKENEGEENSENEENNEEKTDETEEKTEDESNDLEEFFEDKIDSEKMMEYGELQMSGSDVHASTFAQMKHFPFFFAIENWFLPFDKMHPVMKMLAKKKKSLVTMLMKNYALCNSDKYALAINFINLPDKERNGMENAMKAQKEQFEEMIKELKSLHKNSEEKIIANHYIQDLYRFFTQHPRHFDFENPLKEITSLINKSIFYTIFSNNEKLKNIAGYYFSYNHYNQALRLYLRIFEHKNPDFEVARKIGYCYQKNGQINEALRFYMIAENIEKNDVWVLKRMAFCYRKTGNYRAAADCYNRILEIKTEDLKLIFQQAMCYIENENLEDALPLLHKINYLKPDYPKIKSVLLWCNFVCGKFEQAKELSQKVLSEKPDIQDFIITANVHLALHDKQNALEFYKKAIYMSPNFDAFYEIFRHDRERLVNFGVKNSDIDLLFEIALVEKLPTV